MAYYDALIAAWNGATQPPAGVTGTALLAGDATVQKIAKVNAWAMAGTALPMILPTYKIYNAVVPSEFQALTATQQQLIRDIFGMGTVDASSGTNIRAVILQVFGVGTVTRANLTALAAPYDSPKQPWWQSNGYPSQFHIDDATNAGLI